VDVDDFIVGMYGEQGEDEKKKEEEEEDTRGERERGRD
jgi:hypothetical protein